MGAEGVIESGLRAAGSGYTVDFAATDVAVLLSAFRETKMEGGNVRLTAEKSAADTPWRGHIEAKDFRFLDSVTENAA